MKVIRIAIDGETSIIDHGHGIEHIPCMDESELREQFVASGLRRADAEQRFAATGIVDRVDLSD